jgi:hypothetical protein
MVEFQVDLGNVQGNPENIRGNLSYH